MAEEYNYLNIVDVLVNLYDHEINAGINSFWDGDFRVFIGDEQGNGIKVEESFDTSCLFRAGNWLNTKAKEIYPEYEPL